MKGCLTDRLGKQWTYWRLLPKMQLLRQGTSDFGPEQWAAEVLSSWLTGAAADTPWLFSPFRRAWRSSVQTALQSPSISADPRVAWVVWTGWLWACTRKGRRWALSAEWRGGRKGQNSFGLSLQAKVTCWSYISWCHWSWLFLRKKKSEVWNYINGLMTVV